MSAATAKKSETTVSINGSPQVPLEQVTDALRTIKLMKNKPDALFQEVRAKKKKLSDKKKTLKELVLLEPGAEEARDRIKTLQEKLKDCRKTVENRNKELISDIESLKAEIRADEDLLDDVLLSKIAKAIERGENIQLKLFDEDRNEHVAIPKFSIRPVDSIEQ